MIRLSLQPQDFLFFKDTRPMFGASPGRGACLPMQHVLNGALHSALHRAFPQSGSLDGEKIHRSPDGSFRFGNLTSVGPFFSDKDNSSIYFPTPLDLCTDTGDLSHAPLHRSTWASSLPAPLTKPVVSRVLPSKNEALPLISLQGYQNYLAGKKVESSSFRSFDDFFLTENAVGIAMKPEGRSVEEGMLYTSERMRLREEARIVAYADFKVNGKNALQELFHEQNRILVGGESRLCSVQTEVTDTLQFPIETNISGTKIKFTLLTPAIFVAAPDHPGGWLPNWVSYQDGSFRLLDGPGSDKVRRLKKKFPDIKAGQPIDARIVAAHIAKPQIVSGWAQGKNEGAKSTLFSVPAGSVYYFEASNEENAQKLVSSLNWRTTDSTTINRRSALMGEKGYGIGVCSSWQDLENINS